VIFAFVNHGLVKNAPAKVIPVKFEKFLISKNIELNSPIISFPKMMFYYFYDL